MDDNGETGHTQTWEVCSASRTVKEVWPRITESIEAAQKLGLTWVSLTTERNDHFAHGGNVGKAKCVKYVLVVRSGVPPLVDASGGGSTQDEADMLYGPGRT